MLYYIILYSKYVCSLFVPWSYFSYQQLQHCRAIPLFLYLSFSLPLSLQSNASVMSIEHIDNVIRCGLCEHIKDVRPFLSFIEVAGELIWARLLVKIENYIREN